MLLAHQFVFLTARNIYRVIHKSVKHFKNSQQIDYATDHGNSYADRDRNSPSFFYIFHRCSMFPPFVIRQTFYAIVHLLPHACQHITVDGHTCYYCLLAANEGNYVRELFLLKNLESFSLYRRKNYHDPFCSLFVANF
jgi:hypothetical protein